MYYIFLIFLIVFLFIYLNKYEKFVNYQNKTKPLIFDKNQYNNFILKNQDKVYRVNLIKNKEDINDCYKKCNFSDCLKLEFMKKKYEKCISCQKNNSNKCFNNLPSNGTCDDCGENLNRFNCNDINKFACPNLKDVYNINGIEPYYLQVINEKNITSPYKQSCLFCWNLKNYL